MNKISIDTEYIKLDSALKLSGVAAMGSEAKYLILDGKVLVNGEIELRRGRKLYPGDSFTFDDDTYEIE